MRSSVPLFCSLYLCTPAFFEDPGFAESQRGARFFRFVSSDAEVESTVVAARFRGFDAAFAGAAESDAPAGAAVRVRGFFVSAAASAIGAAARFRGFVAG